MASDGFQNVYDWICHLHNTLKDVESTASLDLTSMDAKMISVHAHSNGYGVVFLGLWWDSVCLGDLGECSIENSSEEAMQENLFPLFSDLCVYAFFKVSHQVIANLELPTIGCSNLLRLGLKKFKENLRSWYRSRSEEDKYMLLDDGGRPKIDRKLDAVELQGLDIESAIYKRAFNSIFQAASYSHLLLANNQISTGVVPKLAEQTLKRTLVIIGQDATDRLMRSLAAKFIEIRLRYGTVSVDPFQVSYSSSLARYWTINAYCPRLSMQLQLPSNQDQKKDPDLELALSHQLMHSMIHFRHEVNVFEDWLDVELHIDNLRCQAFPLNPSTPFPSHLEKEWYFPAKIALTVWPENKSCVHVFSCGASSQNPEATVTRDRKYEATLKAQQAIGTKIDFGWGADLKIGLKNSFSNRVNNWRFSLFPVNNTEARLEWTLYDNSYVIPVFSYTPPEFNALKGKTWSRGDNYKAFRAFAQGEGEGSVSPFTPSGGVVFARDVYGIPITWRLNRDLEGQTLKWIVEGEIWFAYYPNKYHTNRYMEIRSHKFREQVELPLLQSQPQLHGNPSTSSM